MGRILRHAYSSEEGYEPYPQRHKKAIQIEDILLDGSLNIQDIGIILMKLLIH